jgi:C-terminal processing protease CtpA/Prc
VVALLLLLLVAACGDNDVRFPPSSDYAARCQVPRTGVDPITNDPYPDVQASTADEKTWVRSWTDEYYLWYREVPNYKGDQFTTVIDYFEALRTHEATPSGAPKDRFHFTYPTDEWESSAVTGTDAGFGARIAVVVPAPPRLVFVVFTEPGSPADGVLFRGDKILTVDGVDVTSGSDVDTLNNGLFPATVGETHVFEVESVGQTTTHMVSLVSASITSTPVQHVSTVANGQVGYLLFNDHIVPAEKELYDAFTQLAAAGVTDLVLDMRYNGGGYLVIAAELAYMIAGPTATAGRTFELEQFNDKYPNTDPFSGEALTPTPFQDKTVFEDMTQLDLPHLDLKRVFVLTGPNTCSASEAVINSLSGIGVDVIQIGDTTCGKPYGFYPADNCGTTYFAIQFRGVNDAGFGDYSDGFSPDGTTNATLPGCLVPDDLAHALGDPAELRLAAALQYRDTQTCPAAHLRLGDGHVVKPLWLQNRIKTKRN